MKKSSFLLPSMTAALLLSACGGGGDTADTRASTTGSTITASNSTKAAINAYVATSFISTSAGAVDAMLTGVSVKAGSIGVVGPALALVARAYRSRPLHLLSGIATSGNCSGGGTVSINGSMQNESAASNGDVLTITSSNCVESGITTNGSINVTFSGITGTAFSSGPWTATMAIRFNGLESGNASETIGVSGDMAIVANQASSTSGSYATSGAALRISRTVSGTRLNELTMIDYAATEVLSGTTISDTANFTLSGNNDALGTFSYTVRNLQPFVHIGASAPTSGALIAYGTSSSVTATVVDASKARLDYSAMGDGVITQSTTLDWSAFLAAM